MRGAEGRSAGGHPRRGRTSKRRRRTSASAEESLHAGLELFSLEEERSWVEGSKERFKGWFQRRSFEGVLRWRTSEEVFKGRFSKGGFQRVDSKEGFQRGFYKRSSKVTSKAASQGRLRRRGFEQGLPNGGVKGADSANFADMPAISLFWTMI